MLKRKLWRDIKSNYGAYLAVTSVLIIGLMLYVSLSIILDNLINSQQTYYEEANFAEGYAKVVKAPKAMIKDTERLEGINNAEGRIVQDVLVYKTKAEETTTLRVVSFNDNQSVNKFKLVEGTAPRPVSKELLVSPAFLEGNGLKIGDKIPLIFHGRQIDFVISGTANSPEFIYEIPSTQTITPNPKTFGVGYLHYDTVSALMGMEGQINDIVFTLESGVEFEDVKRTVVRQYDYYGLLSIYPRKDQLSHSLLAQELVGLEASATTTPLMFLFVAASILYIMLRRMVEHQRGQIGFLKSFGFSDWEILSHYLWYAILIGFLGGLGGSLAGGAFSYKLAEIYQQFYNIPDLNGSFSLSYIIMGTLASVLFSAFAGFQGAKRVLKLSPSEAMRPPAPKNAGKTLIEQIDFIWALLNIKGKMAVRNIFRSKPRNFLAAAGIASAFSMMVASGASFDASDFLVSYQFDKVEKYDLKIGLNKLTDINEIVTAGKHLQGVQKAEPLLEVPVTVNHKWLKKDIVIMGLPQHPQLYNLITDEGKIVEVPANGIILSSHLAKLLNVKPGDTLNVIPFLGEKREKEIKVVKVIPQYVGLGAYMEIGALSKLVQATDTASSLLIKVDSSFLPEIRKELQGAKNVSAIHDKTKMKAQFEELMATTKSTQFVLLFFAFLTGFAIVYNVTLISLSEREREFATLLIMGMTEKEVGKILYYEQLFLGLLGISLGIPLSYAMLYAMITSMANEIFNIPVIISLSSILTGIVGTIIFLLASQWKAKGKITKLSMLDVLKEQE